MSNAEDSFDAYEEESKDEIVEPKGKQDMKFDRMTTIKSMYNRDTVKTGKVHEPPEIQTDIDERITLPAFDTSNEAHDFDAHDHVKKLTYSQKKEVIL